jgi:hypothetical protein
MRIVLYGEPIGNCDGPTLMPFLLNGRIERIFKDGRDLQDLEADIAIANWTRSPKFYGGTYGNNYERLPKVKVQLAIQGEHYSEYTVIGADIFNENFDGSICGYYNKPFWESMNDMDEYINTLSQYKTIFGVPTIEAMGQWDPIVAAKPRFYFDPLVKWNNFYKGPVTSFSDYGCILGGGTEYRENIVNNTTHVKYAQGDTTTENFREILRKVGIGFNIHKFELERSGPKTEAPKIALFYNLGMAIVTEKLDGTFPERLRDCIIEVDDIKNYKIDKEQLYQQALKTEKVFNEYHDLNTELDILLNNIIRHFNL